MAGHSQFKNIMHRKGAQDAKRSKIFSKLAREITVAAKLGLPDPAMNPRLRSAILAARAENMPKDNIDRAIKKAAGGEGDNYEEVRYEGYGPSGIAIVVEGLTDNRNRTASEVRSIFTKYGGNLGSTGSVAHMFDRIGVITYRADAAGAEEMLEAAIEAGAEDCVSGEDGHEIVTTVEDLGTVRDALEEKLGAAENAKLTFRPSVTSAVDEDTARSLLKMIDLLEDNDDVQNVYSNFEVSDEIMEKLSA